VAADEWPEDEKAPTKYWFSTLPAKIAFRQLVDTAKLRWRIESDYHEHKQEVGLATSKGEAGAAAIIMQRYASQPMEPNLRAGDDPPSGARFPGYSKKLSFPKPIARGGSAIAA
jgi:hypothetical protein